MKLIFMGTPLLAVPFLQELQRDHEIAIVVTQPDSAVGRSKTPQPSPVKAHALQHGFALAQPQRARDEDFIAHIESIGADAIVVVAYGQILPRAILDAPKLACLNAHFSLLPRWRGAAPVQYALLHGDGNIGVTIQHMTEKLDAGDIVLQEETPIERDETTADLWQRLTPIGARVLATALREIESGTATRTPQNENLVTLAPQLRKSDGAIQWQENARNLENRIRATNPWPGAFCTFRGKTLKVWRARAVENEVSAAPGTLREKDNQLFVATGNGALLLEEIQSEGKPRMSAADWLRGARLQSGETLGDGALPENAS